ncbi:MAG TPA: acyl-CoA dehydrogenase family protein [Pseudogracilibacillus sp.]|nr:acyl-CoA dehydrogenase family protein [Pseudogracilibacillus sp.]
MVTKQLVDYEKLAALISKELAPHVKSIDENAFYAKSFIEQLGKEHFFQPSNERFNTLLKRFAVIEETAKVCMTTAFCLWCQFAAITYVTHTKNETLQNAVLQKLLDGTLLAGTGLSNPLKSFANLEKLHLTAKRARGGYTINGSLPAVSNIGREHAFAFIAGLNSEKRIMGFVYCNDDNIHLRSRTGYIGLNGSATYAVTFDDVFIQDEQIIATDVEGFIEEVRPSFVAYQVPLALGVTAASVDRMKLVSDKQGNVNKYLRTQPEDLEQKNNRLRSHLIAAIDETGLHWDDILSIRLHSVYTTLEAVQAAMIHQGGSGYVKSSAVERKLREAYFLVHLTPTVKHLELLRNERKL